MLVAGGQSPESGLVALPDDEATAVTKLVTHDDFLHRPHILRLTATIQHLRNLLFAGLLLVFAGSSLAPIRLDLHFDLA